MINMVNEHNSMTPTLQNNTRFYIPRHCCTPRAYELHNPQPATRKPDTINWWINLMNIKAIWTKKFDRWWWTKPKNIQQPIKHFHCINTNRKQKRTVFQNPRKIKDSILRPVHGDEILDIYHLQKESFFFPNLFPIQSTIHAVTKRLICSKNFKNKLPWSISHEHSNTHTHIINI